MCFSDLKNIDTRLEGVVMNMNKIYGFSGAQVGAAKNLAWVFFRNGYAKRIKNAREDKNIKTKQWQ